MVKVVEVWWDKRLVGRIALEPSDNDLIDLAVNVGLNRKQASEILGLIRDEVKMSGIELF